MWYKHHKFRRLVSIKGPFGYEPNALSSAPRRSDLIDMLIYYILNIFFYLYFFLFIFFYLYFFIYIILPIKIIFCSFIFTLVILTVTSSPILLY